MPRDDQRVVRRHTPRPPQRERGVVLMIALIVLVALTLAGLSMVRTVDTGSVISGNLGFRQAAVQATDAAVEQAYSAITTIYKLAPDTPVPNIYVPFRANLATDTVGVPLNAAATPVDLTIAAAVPVANLPTGYAAWYYVERLCVGTAAIGSDTDKLQTQCITERATNLSDSKKYPGGSFFGTLKTNYRVTVQVSGPRNTVSLAQATFSF